MPWCRISVILAILTVAPSDLTSEARKKSILPIRFKCGVSYLVMEIIPDYLNVI